MSILCPFCDRRAFEDNLIFESANFLVFPTKGQVTEGYLLIVPKRHTICFGELTTSEIEEFTQVKAKITDALLQTYGQRPIFFEHGIVGQTVKHAHIHAVPTNTDLFSKIESDFPDYQKISSFESLQETFQREGPYLYYENASGEMFIFHIFKWPQYLRLVLADTMGVPERGDWRKMDQVLDKQLVFETWRKLKPIL